MKAVGITLTTLILMMSPQSISAQEPGREGGIKERIASILKRMDKDGDSAVSKAEAGEFWARLAATDRNQDGVATSDEMFKAWSMQGVEKRAPLSREEFAKLEAEVKQAVASGKLTEAEGQAKLAAARRAMREHSDRRQAPNAEEVVKRIEAAVKEGKLTPEEGKAKIAAYRKEQAERRAAEEKQRAALVAEIAQVEADVKAGKLTPKQGEEKIQALKHAHQKPMREHEAGDDHAGDRKHAGGEGHDGAGEHGQDNGRKDEPLGRAIKAINDAVKAGELTPEQGKAKIEALKKDRKEMRGKRARSEKGDKGKGEKGKGEKGKGEKGKGEKGKGPKGGKDKPKG